ncbi:MAG: hypothetical protein JW951_08095, partial [Lentisphaerae bacterium]|nr:hypothetical protein [Lentisphaerota bacterium]
MKGEQRRDWGLRLAACTALALSALSALSAPDIEMEILPVGRTLDAIAWSSSSDPIEWVAGIQSRLDERMESARLVWTVTPWQGAAEHVETPLVLGEKRHPYYKNFTPVPILYTPQRLGWHELTVELLGPGGEALARRRQGFAVYEPARSSGRHFRYGITGTGIRPSGEEFNRYMETIRALGVDIHREVFYWPQAQQDAQPVYEFQYHDTVRNMLQRGGIDALWCFLWTPHWAVEADIAETDWPRWALSMPRLEAWTRFVRAAASHFKGRVRYYEVWNEPDLGDYWVDTPASHAQLQNAAFEVIKEVDPAAQTMNGGFGMFSMEPNPDFLEQFLPRAETGHWDIRAYHDYHTLEDMQRRLTKHRELYAGNVMETRPVW